ncbi:hypothetical protein EVB27_059 [Rhizobium phage RHph_TM16]|nr:hypothetical protein EVB27_059 [Rhizobium phage RHph_TM16]
MNYRYWFLIDEDKPYVSAPGTAEANTTGEAALQAKDWFEANKPHKVPAYGILPDPTYVKVQDPETEEVETFVYEALT